MRNLRSGWPFFVLFSWGLTQVVGLSLVPLSAQAVVSPSSWADLKSAFSGVTSTETIVLGADISQTGDYLEVPSGTSITLDLNGHSLSVTSANGSSSAAPFAALSVPSTSSLTITGNGGGSLSVTGGNGVTVASGAHTGGAAGIGGNGGTAAGANCGTVIIKAGTITAQGGTSGTGASSSVGGGGGAGIGGGGGGTSKGGDGCTLTVQGGSLTSTGGLASTATQGKGGGGAAFGGGGGGGNSTGTDSAAGAAGTLSILGTGSPVSAGAGGNGTSPFPYKRGFGGLSPVPSVGTYVGAYFTQTATSGATTSSAGTGSIAFSYDVTFDSSGGSSVVSQRINYGSLVALPTQPTFQGKNFQSWKLVSSSGVDYSFSNVVIEPFTLFASWNTPNGSTGNQNNQSELANTGFDAGNIIGLATILLVVGGALLFVRKRNFSQN